MDNVLQALGALAPPVGVGLIFWFALRSIIRADRTERAAMARLDAIESGLIADPDVKGTGTTAPGSAVDKAGGRTEP